MATRPCAVYLRSSKDRSDVSPEAQRGILAPLFRRYGLVCVAEYVDVVLSGKHERRPDYQRLRADLNNPGRGWSLLVMIDFERLARKGEIALKFEGECRRAGVEIMYGNMPESTPMLDMVVKPMMHGYAEYRSWEAKMKGLAGMRVNVAHGFRAGGAAPYGYALQHVELGAVREGKPVLKSRLVLAEGSAGIARYLKGRAAGRKGTALAREIGLHLSRSTLTGIEWTALTYAGHTVWNVHNERIHGGGYVNGTKRRPRDEWVIQRNTHIALIADDEAEAILAALGKNPYRDKRPRSATSANLLAGVLVTRTGHTWHVDRGGKYYRRGTKSRLASTVDRAVLRGMMRDLSTDQFVEALIGKTMAAIAKEAGEAGPAAIDRELADCERQIGRLTALLPDTAMPAPLLRAIERLEGQRLALVDRRATALQRARAAREAARVTPEHVRQAVQGLRASIETMDPAQLKPTLQAFVQRVELEPGGSSARICYQIRPVGRVNVASPGGSALFPTVDMTSVVRLPERRRARSIPQKRAA